MELYQAYTDYNGMMELTENLYRYLAQEVVGSTTITYNGIEMDLGKPFEKITMVDAVKKYAGVDFDEIHTVEDARKAADEHHVEYEERHKKEISSICSLRSLWKINLFSLPLFWIIRWRYLLLQKEAGKSGLCGTV